MADEPKRPAQLRMGELTLHQLRIFWAVAHSATLTSAARQLGLAQPSLSQQLGKLEANVGTLLFYRRSNEMELTEAGQYLLPRVEQVLRNINELEDGLGQFSGGERITMRIAGINSVLRVLVPRAVATMQQRFAGVEFDLQESSPGEILDMLYGRRVNVGILAASSVAQSSVGFVQVPLLDDPYVLVVPETLVLDGVIDPQRELAPEQWAVLNRSIQFIFGSQQAQRVAQWYDRMLPNHRVAAQCRTFDTAISLVRAGAGVCLAPGLTLGDEEGLLAGVRTYRVQAPPRSLVALVPSQYRRSEPYSTWLDLLIEVAADYAPQGFRPTPPFLAEGAPQDL